MSESPTLQSENIHEKLRADSSGKLYDGFLDSLLFQDSAEQIRQSVLSTRGLELRRLRRALDERLARLRECGEADELALLEYMQEVLHPVLDAVEPDDMSFPSSIETLEDLVCAAARCENALRIRKLYRAHRNLLDADALKRLAFAAVEPGRPLTWDVLKRFVIGVLVAGSAKQRAECYMTQASFYRDMHDARRAMRALHRATARARDVGDVQLQAMAQATLGGLHRAMRDIPQALRVFEQVLTIVNDDDTMALGLNEAIADCARDLGQYSCSLAALDRAIEIMEYQVKAIPHREILDKQVWLIRNRGLVQDHLGRYDRALLDYEKALRLATESGDQNAQFVLMNDVGASHQKRGRERAALQQFRKILRTAETWRQPSTIAAAHNNLGNMLLILDRPSDALAEFQKALKFNLNRMNQGESITLQGMASSLEKLGDKESAATWRAISLLPALESGDLAALDASAHDEQEDQSECTARLERVVSMARSAGYRFQELLAVRHLADHYLTLGERTKAVELYKTALANVSTQDLTAMEAIRAEVGYARLLGSEAATRPEAVRRLRHVLEMKEKEVSETLLDEFRSEVIAAARPMYDALLEILACHEGLSAAEASAATLSAFELHEAAKSRSFLSLLADAPLEAPTSVPAPLAKREAELLAEERQLQMNEPRSEASRAERLGILATNLRACRAEMAPYAPEYVQLREGKPLTFAEIRAQLGQRLDRNAGVISLYCGAQKALAFVMGADWASPQLVELPLSMHAVEALTLQLRRAFNGAPEEFPPYPPIIRNRPFARDLSFLDPLSQALAPAFDLLSDAELIHFAPHGPFHLLPFHALRLPSGDYLASRSAVVYWPSISTSLRALQGTWRNRSMRTILVGGVAAQEDPHPEYFERDAEIFAGLPLDVSRVFGLSAATRARLLEMLPQHDIIHLSCHGFFDSADPVASGLLVSDGRRAPPRDPWSISPLERGAFILTTRDLLKQRLRAKMVTLNACSSGLQGSRNAGDELDGFARAMLLAGAESVLVALWNVDQTSSCDFLSHFYKQWLTGSPAVPKWRAFHDAQKAMLSAPEDYLRHPYHWAPFILLGDWQ